MDTELKQKTGKAILRIRQAYEIAQSRGQILICAYSGGKDSDVLLDIALKSGVPFEVQHNHTTVDAPQTVYHIREVFRRLTEQGISNKINYPPMIKDADGKTVRATMWNLIPKKQSPPSRMIRYCCEYFKERVFEGQHIMTGVRWSESAARKNRGLHEILEKDRAKRVVYFDEDDDRHKLTDICQLRNRIATNPLIDWTDREIWDYIRNSEIKVNSLYGMGLARVGCVGCPMVTKVNQNREFELFPKYKAAYLRAFERMVAYINKRRAEKGKPPMATWKDAENVYEWWNNPKYDPDQLTMFDESDAGGDEI